MNLRLLLFSKCNRSCEGCCNKDWDLKGLPVFNMNDVSNYDMIMLTGGEPMLKPELIIKVAKQIKAKTAAPIIVYTAKLNRYAASLEVLREVNGFTVTLHEQKDVKHFKRFAAMVKQEGLDWWKSMRLNVFKGVNISGINVGGWVVKDEIEWIDDCPLPQDEIFMRLDSD